METIQEILVAAQAAKKQNKYKHLELQLFSLQTFETGIEDSYPCARIRIKSFRRYGNLVHLAFFAGTSGNGSYYAWDTETNAIAYYREDRQGNIEQLKTHDLRQIVREIATYNGKGDFAPTFYAEAKIDDHDEFGREGEQYRPLQVGYVQLIERPQFACLPIV